VGNDRQGPVVVNIISTSYAGSTWLNLLLGAHRDAFSVGELDQIDGGDGPVCKLHGPECPFWSRVQPADGVNPYLKISQLADKPYLVVNNTKRYLPQQEHPSVRSRFIWLVRDGRAVVASSLRKYPHLSIWRACRSWVRAMRQTRRLFQRQPAEHRLCLNYEHVTSDKRGQLQRVCQFLGLPFDDRMLRFWEEDHHFVGGNPGPLLAVADAQDTGPLHRQPRPGYSDDTAFYDHADPARFRDERWKRELSRGQLRVFALIAGRWNRRFGYPPSLQKRSWVD
jgi:Sulfotransferase family